MCVLRPERGSCRTVYLAVGVDWVPVVWSRYHQALRSKPNGSIPYSYREKGRERERKIDS